MLLILMIRISFISLSDYSITQAVAAVNSQNTQISGFLPIGFLLELPIDKLRGVWYNGNNARLGRGGAAEKSIGNLHKKIEGFIPRFLFNKFVKYNIKNKYKKDCKSIKSKKVKFPFVSY